MVKLAWDQVGQKTYENGTDHGVLFPYDGTENGYAKGVAWSGLTKVSEASDGAEETALFADNIKYASMTSAENFKGSITAYQSPVEFDAMDGSAELAKGVLVTQQDRVPFGFSYRTYIGNDTNGARYGYKIHLVYGAKVSPSKRDNETINDSPKGTELSWDFTTTPISVEGFKPTAHIIINSLLLDTGALAKLEAKLYGGVDTEPALPTPDELKALLTTSGPHV